MSIRCWVPVLVFLIVPATRADEPRPRMHFPGKDWEIVKPEAEGLDSVKLAAGIEYLKANSGADGIRELVIVRRGRIVWHGDTIDNVHRTYSCTKSFTSTVLGLLIDDGKCSLETKTSDFIPQLKDRYPTVTLRHFTTMTSGYRAAGDAEAKGRYAHGPSQTPFVPAEPLFAPGEKYAYWDSAMNVLGLALTKIAGEPLDVMLKRRIMDPIGANPDQWRWGIREQSLIKERVNNGAGNAGAMEISAREMARFGHLFLNEGNWNGKQLISAKWVAQARAVQVPAILPDGNPRSEIDGSGCYGFNWWVNGARADEKRMWPDAPATTFAAIGHNDNYVWIIPEWQIVIVRLGMDGGRGKLDANGFLKRVGAAVIDRVGE